MRPLHHPHADEMTVEGILYALSDPVRAQILIQLRQCECAQNCSTFIKFNGAPLPKSTLSQHFRILREAGLIRCERKGVELHNTPRCADFKERFGPMVEAILKGYTAQDDKKKKKR